MQGQRRWAIFVCPNPLNPKNRLVIYGTVSPDALINMNGIFHGPTDYIVFNNTTRQFRGVNAADQFLLMGSFDKSDPTNWRVDETLQSCLQLAATCHSGGRRCQMTSAVTAASPLKIRGRKGKITLDKYRTLARYSFNGTMNISAAMTGARSR